MSTRPGASKGDKKCGDKGCECTNFEPDAFRKDKCRNCFHVHPPAESAAASAVSPRSTPNAVRPSAPLSKTGSDRALIEKAVADRALNEKVTAEKFASMVAERAERIAAEKAAAEGAERAHDERPAEEDSVDNSSGERDDEAEPAPQCTREWPPDAIGICLCGGSKRKHHKTTDRASPFRAAPPPSRKPFSSATLASPLARPPAVPSHPSPGFHPKKPYSSTTSGPITGGPSPAMLNFGPSSPLAHSPHLPSMPSPHSTSTPPPIPSSPVPPLDDPSCDHAAALEFEEPFCMNCGARMPESTLADIEVLCICGNRYEDWDKFCTRCGEQASTSRGKLFDGIIDAHVRFSPFAVPEIVYHCTEYLKQHALSLEGIFRVPGNNDAIQDIKADFEQEYKSGKEEAFEPSFSSDPHTVAGILKLYYRKLRVPVIPFPMYDDWINLTDKGMSESAQLRKLRTLVFELPAAHRTLLAYHLGLLQLVSANEAETKMGARNCAMVFAPGLLRKPDGEISDSMLAKEMALSADVLELLLVNYTDVFPEGCPDPKGPKPMLSPQPPVVRVRMKPGASPTVRDNPALVPKLAPEKALEKQREEMEEFAARAQQNLFKMQAMPGKEALDAQFHEFMESKKFVAHAINPVSDKLADVDKWQILCVNNEAQLAIIEGKTGVLKDPLSLYEGWLLLIVNHSTKHASYFFTLRPGVLRYYTAKDDKKPVGEIVFSKSTSRYQNSNSTTKSPNPQFPYPFVLDTQPEKESSGKYALYSESKDAREAWMLYLELAIVSDPEKNKPLSANTGAYELTLSMMIGIRTSVGRTGGMALSAIAAEKDFHDMMTYNFPAKGSKETPPHKLRDFGFKDYCPSIFRRIRQHFGIDPSSYLLGVCGNSDYLNFVSNSRSGEFFFYSHDRKYMIKTISQNECKCLFANMSNYYRHLMNNRDCLINKFFGLHKVKPADQSCKWFLVMGSVFPSHLKMHRLFDLKGSTHNRQVKPSDRGKDGTVYKDNDFVQQGAVLAVGAENKAKLERQLKRDTEWLEGLRIIDYSVLLGMHYRQGFYASSTNVQIFVSDSFFGDNQGQTLAIEFKAEDTVGEIIKMCVKMMRALPKMQLNNPPQEFCLVRSDGREVLDEKAQMARQTPLTLMEIILKEALPKTALPSPHHRPSPSLPPVSVNPRVNQAVTLWKAALAELCPGLHTALKGLSETELIGLTTAEIVAKAKGNPIAGCLLTELKHMIEAASGDAGPVLSSFTETEGGLAAKDEMGNDVILYIGIIDTLIEYNLKKKMEHQYKHKVKGLDEAAFSVVEPNMYAQRLLGFITDKIR